MCSAWQQLAGAKNFCGSESLSDCCDHAQPGRLQVHASAVMGPKLHATPAHLVGDCLRLCQHSCVAHSREHPGVVGLRRLQWLAAIVAHGREWAAAGKQHAALGPGNLHGASRQRGCARQSLSPLTSGGQPLRGISTLCMGWLASSSVQHHAMWHCNKQHSAASAAGTSSSNTLGHAAAMQACVCGTSACVTHYCQCTHRLLKGAL